MSVDTSVAIWAWPITAPDPGTFLTSSFEPMIVSSSIPEPELAEVLSVITVVIAASNGSNARFIIRPYEIYSM
jgi:hypothetical protein